MLINMVGGGSSPDLPIGSHINVTSDIGAIIQCKKGSLEYAKVVGRLPSEYQEVEYIQSSGTQYINISELHPIGKLETKFRFTGSSVSNNAVFGKFNNSTQSISAYGSSVGTLRCHIALDALDVLNSASINTDYTFAWDFDNKTITTNGTIFTYTNSIVDNTMNCYLFALNVNNSVDNPLTGRIYYLKEYNSNNELILDLVPCKNSSDEFGMYDLVTETFFGNSGTGSFTGGSPVTQGTVSFEIHNSGTWNLTANKTGETELTDSVVVSADDTDYPVSMFWRLYLYNAGDECTSLTGGWIIPQRSSRNGTVTKNNTNITLSNNISDYGCAICINNSTPSGYSTLKVLANVNIESSSSAFMIILADSKNYSNTPLAQLQITSSSESTLSLNIGSILTTSYVMIKLYQGSSGTTNAVVEKIWLE